MVIQLPLVFSFPVHFRHSLQALEHCLDDAIICHIHVLSDLQSLRPDHQRLDSANVDREVFHKLNYATAFSASEFSVFDAFDLLVLGTVAKMPSGTDQREKITAWILTTCLSNWAFNLPWCFSSSLSKYSFSLSSALDMNISSAAKTPIICL